MLVVSFNVAGDIMNLLYEQMGSGAGGWLAGNVVFLPRWGIVIIILCVYIWHGVGMCGDVMLWWFTWLWKVCRVRFVLWFGLMHPVGAC